MEVREDTERRMMGNIEEALKYRMASSTIKEAIESRIASLTKEKEELVEAIKKEQGNSIEKSYVQEEFERDLGKIQKELDTLEQDNKKLDELIDESIHKGTQVEDMKEELKRLRKDKEGLEEEIKGLEGKRQFIDGILQKTPIQQEYERDLEKLVKEIAEKEDLIATDGNLKIIAKLNQELKELADKYFVKVAEEIDGETKQQPEKSESEEKGEPQQPPRIEMKGKTQQTEKTKPEEPVKPQQAEKTEPEELVKPQQAGKTESKEPVKPQQAGKAESEETIKPPRKSNWKVESVEFTIEGGSNPTYRVIVAKGAEQKVVTSTGIAILDGEFDKNEIRTLNQKYGIHQVEKYYDKGLAIALEKADAEYGTEGLKEYRKLLQEKEMINRYPDRYRGGMDISYDFSGLLVKPDENMKRLQKMAKASRNKGVVVQVKGRPNFLKRLIKRIFTKSIPEKTKMQKPVTRMEKEKTKKDIGDLEARMMGGRQELTEDRIMRDWIDMHDEPGFDIEEFVKDMTIEKANEYRVLQDKYKAGLQKDPYKTFRKKVQKETRVVDGKLVAGKGESETEVVLEDDQYMK